MLHLSGKRAWPQILSTVHALAAPPRYGEPPLYAPVPSSNQLSANLAEKYLAFLGKVMNSFCVSMMQWGSKTEETTPSPPNARRGYHRYDSDDDDTSVRQAKSTTMASERALSGYCAYHHLLLVFCDRFPGESTVLFPKLPPCSLVQIDTRA